MGRKLTVYASLLVDIVCQGCNHNTFPRGSQDRVEEILKVDQTSVRKEESGIDRVTWKHGKCQRG